MSDPISTLFDAVIGYAAEIGAATWTVKTLGNRQFVRVIVVVDGQDVVDVAAHRAGEAHRKALDALRAYLSQGSTALVGALQASLEEVRGG